MKILFLTQSVTGSQVIRCYPFAEVLAKKHDVEIIGPGTKKLYIDSTEKIKISSFPKTILSIGKILRKAKDKDIICISKPMYLTSIAAYLLKIKGKKIILDIDDDELELIKHDIKHYYHNPLRLTRMILSYFIIRFNLSIKRISNKTIVASSYLQKKFKGTILPVPVDLKKWRSGTKLNYKGQIILYAGVIRRYKGIETLIKAFPLVKEKIKNTKLLIVGPITTEFAKQMIDKTKDQKDILWLGKQPLDKMPDFHATADCLVLASPDNLIHRMQTPIKLMHYLASARPIVATDVGDVRKYVKNYLAEPNNPKDLAIKIIKALKEKKVNEFKYNQKAIETQIEKIFTK